MNKLLFFLIGAVICLFILSKCDSCTKEGYPTSRTDTVYVKTVDSGSYQPHIDFIEGGKIPSGDSVLTRKPKVQGTDTLWIYEKVWQPVDTAAILKDHFSRVHYADTQNVTYGKLIIWDTVAQNRITGRSFRLDQDIPVITKTITTSPKRKVKGYLTGTIQGIITDPLQAAGPGFMLQFKNDDAIEINRLFGSTSSPYQLSYKFKLSFTKN